MRRQDTLDLRINTVYDLPLDGELELNVTAKSNDQVGPGAIFSVTKRNVFGGGETFGVKLRGSYEWQTGNKLDGSNSKINSYELGLTTTLTFPRVLFPTFSKRDMNFPASTTFRLYADQMNRARFFKLLAFGGDASYEFQPTATSHHSITPFKLTFNLLQHTTHEFDSITNVNKALKKSLQNQFIPAMNYTYTYDDSPFINMPLPYLIEKGRIHIPLHEYPKPGPFRKDIHQGNVVESLYVGRIVIDCAFPVHQRSQGQGHAQEILLPIPLYIGPYQPLNILPLVLCI